MNVINDNLSSIIKTLNIHQKNYRDSNLESVIDPTLEAIIKDLNQPGILALKGKAESVLVFTFNHITKEDIIKDLNVSKASQENDMPIKIIKKNVDAFTTVFKEGTKYSKENYRPVNILPNI